MSAASGNPRGVLWRIWKPGLASGLLTIIVGGLVLALPQASILVAATLFRVFLLGTGLAQLFFAFTLPKSASGRALLFINGALSLVLATLSFRHFGDAYAVLLLSIWIGVGFIFQGVAETVTAINYQELPGRGWYIFAWQSHRPTSTSSLLLAARRTTCSAARSMYAESLHAVSCAHTLRRAQQLPTQHQHCMYSACRLTRSISLLTVHRTNS